jgi:hypothetical protein
VSESGIIIEHVETFGWKHALRGMRNPMESWDSADSEFLFGHDSPYGEKAVEGPLIGPKDLKRALSLIRGGEPHRKFGRAIWVGFDIVIPIYVWSEFDTYKVAVTRNSCSTMHKLGHRDLLKEDFTYGRIHPIILKELNALGKALREARAKGDKVSETACLKTMKKDLPGGYLQRASISCNYEVLINMYYQRRDHRLDEWHDREDNEIYSICNMIKDLPYMSLFLEAKNKKGKKIKEIVASHWGTND